MAAVAVVAICAAAVVVTATANNETIEDQTVTVTVDTTIAAQFVVSKYKLTVNTMCTGTGKILIDGMEYGAGVFYLTAGSTITVTAETNADCTLSALAVTGGTSAEGSYTVTSDMVITAVVEQVTAVVTRNIPENGSLLVLDDTGTAIPSGTIVPVGTRITLVTSADAHYVLSKLTVGGANLTSGSGEATGYFSFLVDAARGNDILCQFTVTEVVVLWSATQGSVSVEMMPDGAEIANGQYVPVGADLKISTTPKNDNYVLDTLTVTGASRDEATGWYRAGEKEIVISASFRKNDDDNVQQGFTITGLEDAVVYGDVITLGAPDAEGTVTFTITEGDAAVLQGNVLTAVGVGKVVVTATSVLEGYQDRIVTRTVIMGKKALTPTAVMPSEAPVYDGDTAVDGVTIALAGIVGADQVFVSAAAQMATADVGTDQVVTITLSQLTGEQAYLYTLSETMLIGKVNVLSKPVESITATVADKEYDGTTKAEITEVTLAGVLGADHVDQIITQTFMVYARVLYPTVTTTGCAYNGGTAVEVTVTLGNVIEGDQVTADGVTAQLPTADVGTDRLVTVTISGLAGEDAALYELSTTLLNSTVTVTAAGKIYDGTTAADLIAVLSGDKVTIVAEGAYTTANAGTTKATVTALTLSGNDADNYILVGTAPATAEGKIDKATVTFTTESKTFTYDVTVTLNDGQNYVGAPAPFTMEILPADQDQLIISGMPGVVD